MYKLWDKIIKRTSKSRGTIPFKYPRTSLLPGGLDWRWDMIYLYYHVKTISPQVLIKPNKKITRFTYTVLYLHFVKI
jgi:hypothetical protein